MASDHLQFSRRSPATFGLQFIADFLAIIQPCQARLLYSTDVNEHVTATRVRLNKAIALGRVEPLNNSGRHWLTLSLNGIVAHCAYNPSDRA